MRGLSLYLPRIAIATTVLLVIAGCEGSTPYRKAGTDASQAERDHADCRSRVNAYLAKDRGIDEDRRSGTASGGIGGAGTVRRDMDGSSDGRRSSRLVRDCMAQKGYSGGEPDRGGLRW